MKTEQGEIPALFSCRDAWGWTMPRRGWRADSGAGGGLAALWSARLFGGAIRRGCRGASGKPPACIGGNNLAEESPPGGA